MTCLGSCDLLKLPRALTWAGTPDGASSTSAAFTVIPGLPARSGEVVVRALVRLRPSTLVSVGVQQNDDHHDAQPDGHPGPGESAAAVPGLRPSTLRHTSPYGRDAPLWLRVRLAGACR